MRRTDGSIRGFESDQERRTAGELSPRKLKSNEAHYLQPAMDHLLANSEKAVPEAGAEPVEVDEEDDDEGLKAHIKKLGGAVNDEEMVAKVSKRL